MEGGVAFVERLELLPGKRIVFHVYLTCKKHTAQVSLRSRIVHPGGSFNPPRVIASASLPSATLTHS